MRPLLQVDCVDAGYGGVQVLWEVSLEIRAGEIVALIGANSAGKSTLLRVLSGLLRAWRGGVMFAGHTITTASPEAIVQAGLMHVPQGRRLFPALSVRQNLLLGAYTRRDHRAVADDLAQMLRWFPDLADRLILPAGQLSGGEQQMLALARGLMARPQLLLIDEPSLGLAPLVVRSLMDVLERLRTRGVSVLLVEQDVGLALAHASRAYVLEAGRVALSGSAPALLADPRVRAAYLGLAA